MEQCLNTTVVITDICPTMFLKVAAARGGEHGHCNSEISASEPDVAANVGRSASAIGWGF